MKTRSTRQARRQLLLTGTFFVLVCCVLQLLNALTFANFKIQEKTDDLNKSNVQNQQPSTTEVPAFERFRIDLPVPIVMDRRRSLLHGYFRNQTGFLTIGIPSIQRHHTSYLEGTIASIVSKTKPEDQNSITIVILLSDEDTSVVTQRGITLYKALKDHVDSGFIQIIRVYNLSYPDFDRLERTFGDSRVRVGWRSKQNIDYAYLFLYSMNISQYYLQLEDDVITASNYVKEIKSFIESRPIKPRWYYLQFSHLGFIGKLFRSSDLRTLAEFLLLFYGEQPGDMLLMHLKKIVVQGHDFIRKPSLFQHIGLISSLKNKRQRLVDRYFRDEGGNRIKVSAKHIGIKNPSADVFTTMSIYDHHKPEFAYDQGEDFFWSMTPDQGDYFRISFHKPQNISRIFIQTGADELSSDILSFGVVKISLSETSTTNSTEEVCDNRQPIGQFHKGIFDTSKMSVRFPRNIGCISIEVVKAQKNWLIIREIFIETWDKE